MMAPGNTSIVQQVSFKSSGRDVTLGAIKEFVASCEEIGMTSNQRLKVNAGNDQRDGQWLHLTADKGDNVGGH